MFLYCECGWFQDDFWKKGEYSPLENDIFNSLKSELFSSRIYLPKDEAYSMVGDISILVDENGRFYIDSKEYVAAHLEKIARRIRKMAVLTHEDWLKTKDTFKCPKCGRNDRIGMD